MTGPTVPLRQYSHPIRVLFVCTGNQQRSPFAAGLLRRRVAGSSCPLEVESAGFVEQGAQATRRAIEVASASGVDLSDHRSSPVSEDLLDRVDLTIGMSRQHLVDLILLCPDRWSSCFTLAEVARRASAVGPPAAGESPAAWVARVHGERSHQEILSLPLTEDVEDPDPSRRSSVQRSFRVIERHVAVLAPLLCPA